MNPDNGPEERLFESALELPAGPERQAFLNQACGDDKALRQRLETLFQAHETPGTSLEPDGARLAPATIRLEFAAEEGPGTRIGRYKLLQKIGEGGMGVVYMAEQEEPVRRRVALKIIKLGMDTRQVVARFEAERQALALMDHPNIAKVLDGGATDTGRPYFVMELVQGVPITEYCDKAKLSAKDRVKLFIHVCQAIQSAHQKGIIHRDIKPSNVLVTLHDGVPVPKVIDFGIAKATNQKLTEKTLFTNFATMIGTPAYMSPEQAEMSGLDVDTRTDIYALGVLLYALLTGTTPFPEKRLRSLGYGEMQRVILEEEPERPSTRLSTMANEQKNIVARNCGEELSSLNHLLKGDLDWIVMKCLEKDRTRRFETANGLAADLNRHLDNEPVVARPPSTAYRLQKAWRRNKLAFTAGAAVAAALVIGIGISTWQAVVATHAQTEAVQAKTKAVAAQKTAEVAQGAEKEARQLADKQREEAAHNLYIANMNLAQQAWDENDIGRLRRALEDTKDSPYRGFEWYYWQKQTHRELKTLRGHLSAVLGVAFSPDGQRIATCSADHTAKLWDAASSRELLTLQGHRGWIHSVAFSPDGRRIVTGSDDETAKIWEAATGRELLTLSAQRGAVLSVAFSPDGRRIVTGQDYGTVKVWDAATGQELLSFKLGNHYVFSVTFSPDGKSIVANSAEDDGTAKVCDAATGRELLTLKGNKATVRSASFSPDRQRIATGSVDGTAKVWEAGSGRELLTLRGHSGDVYSVGFSPDGRQIMTSSDDGTAKVWNAVSGKELFTLKGHEGPVYSAAYAPDGRRIVTGGEDGTAKVWDSGSASSDLTVGNLIESNGQTNSFWYAAFMPDGQMILTSAGNTTVWDASSGRELFALNAYYDARTSCSDGPRIVVAGEGGTAKVLEAASGRELLTLKGHSDDINCVAYSTDFRRIVTGSTDKTAKVWEASSGKELLTLKGHTKRISVVAFSPDNQRILTASDDKTVKIWEASSGRELQTLNLQSNDFSFAAFLPGSKRVVASAGATGFSDGITKIWEASSGRELLTLKGAMGDGCVSPDGQRIATTGVDGKPKMWDASTGRELFTFQGHKFWVFSPAFSPDGQRVLVGCDDRTARLCEASSGRVLLTLGGHKSYVSSVAFSSDGRRIVTVGQSVKLWEAAEPAQVADWQEEERVATQTIDAQRLRWRAEEERQQIARDSASVKQWLILGPISLAPGQTTAEGLDFPYLEGEAGIKPRTEEPAVVGGASLKWREVALEKPVIDFTSILGQKTNESVAYAVCYLKSETEQRGLRMLVGGNIEGKMLLNGKEVYRAPVPHTWSSYEHPVGDIVLNPGQNVLVLKVVTGTNGWDSSVCLTDAEGNPVKGIQVTLNRDTN